MADLKALKKLFGAMESDLNPDAKHRTIASGMHQGTSAIGQAGMMPQTAKLLANRNIRDNKATELDHVINAAPLSGIEEILKDNPDKYNEYVDSLVGQVSDSSKGNPADAYTRWLHGQSLPDNKVKEIQADNPDIAKRLEDRMQEYNLMSQPDDFIEKLKQPAPEQLYSKVRKALK